MNEHNNKDENHLRKSISIRLSLKSSSHSQPQQKQQQQQQQQQQKSIVEITPEMTFKELDHLVHSLFASSCSSSSSTQKSSSPSKSKTRTPKTTTASIPTPTTKKKEIHYWTGYPPKPIIFSSPSQNHHHSTLVQDSIRGGENVWVEFIDPPSFNSHSDPTIPSQSQPSQQQQEQEQEQEREREAMETRDTRIQHKIQKGKGIKPSIPSSTPTRKLPQTKPPIRKPRIFQSQDTFPSLPSNHHGVDLLSFHVMGIPFRDFASQLRSAVQKTKEESRAMVRHASISQDHFHSMVTCVQCLPIDTRKEDKEEEEDDDEDEHEDEQEEEDVQVVHGNKKNVDRQKKIRKRKNTSIPWTCGSYMIRYPKGVEGKGYYEETIQIIDLEVLKEVIRSVYQQDEEQDQEQEEEEEEKEEKTLCSLYQEGNEMDKDKDKDKDKEEEPKEEKNEKTRTNIPSYPRIPNGREMLRPRKMAFVSPRVFWSIWFHFQSVAFSMEDALRIMLPELDWSFFNVGRTRELSAKARENLRQKEEHDAKIQSTSKSSTTITTTTTTTTRKRRVQGKSQSVQESSDTVLRNKKRKEDNLNSAAKMIEDVEHAMMGYGTTSIRDQVAQAAMVRIQNSSNTPDLEMNVGSQSRSNDVQVSTLDWILFTPTELDTDELEVCIKEGMENMMETDQWKQKISIWVQTLIDSCSIRNWREFANGNPSHIFSVLQSQEKDTASDRDHTASSANEVELTEADVDKWVDIAQNRSLDEVMLEILDGNDDVYFTLREEVRSGTPKDLVLWAPIPDLLLDELKCSLGDFKDQEIVVTCSTVAKWCARAQIALDTLPWLHYYVTPLA